MSNLPIRVHCVSLLALMLVAARPWSVRAGQATDTPATQAAACVADDALVAVALRDGDEWLARLRAFFADHRFEQSQAFAAFSAEPQVMQARIGLAGIAATVGTDVWTGVGALLGRDLVVAVAPGEATAGPGVIVASVARDEPLAARIYDTLYVIAGLVKNGEPDPARSELHDGVRVYAVNAQTFHCRVDGVSYVANSRSLLRDALAARRAGTGRLIDSAAYRSAAGMVPDEAAIWAYADVAALTQAAGGEDAVSTLLPNPLGGFLFGAWWHHLLAAETAIVWLVPDDGTLRIEGRVRSREPLTETHRGYLVESGEGDAPVVPRQLACISVQRDWRALWSEREKLLTLPAAGDLVNFANTMTTLLGQLDFVDELLPALDGPARLIVARQDFSAWAGRGTPVPELPSFALVARLKEAARYARRLETASQMALSFVNFDAAQKKQPTLLLGIEPYRGCNIIKAEYPTDAADGAASPMSAEVSQDAASDLPGTQGAAPRPADVANAAADVRYNFAPCAAVAGDYYVVATAPELLRQLIDQLSGETRADAVDAAPSAGDHRRAVDGAPTDRLHIDLVELREILRANRPTLVTNRMIEEDVSREAAERFIDGVLDALSLGRQISLQSTCGRTEARASLQISFAGPVSAATP